MKKSKPGRLRYFEPESWDRLVRRWHATRKPGRTPEERGKVSDRQRAERRRRKALADPRGTIAERKAAARARQARLQRQVAILQGAVPARHEMFLVPMQPGAWHGANELLRAIGLGRNDRRGAVERAMARGWITRAANPAYSGFAFRRKGEAPTTFEPKWLFRLTEAGEKQRAATRAALNRRRARVYLKQGEVAERENEKTG
jgi:hypothetical protein